MWVSIGHYTFHEVMTQAFHIQTSSKSGWLQWLTISRHCCCHSNRTWFTITFVPMDKKLLFYWYLHYITVCLPSPRRSYPMVFMHTVQCSHFLIERHSVWNSLQFFQWLVMLQCCGQSYGSSVSQLIESEAVVRYKHTTTNKFNVSVAMAMIAPHQQAVTDTVLSCTWQ